MTEQEIIETLGIAAATETAKQATLQNINTVVELRTMQALEDILTDDEVAHLEEMERQGSSKDEMLWWLGENVASAHEMISAFTRDYVAELLAKTNKN